MSKTYFISFSGGVGEFDHDLKSRQTLLNKSALIVGQADEAIAWTRDDLLSTDFYTSNHKILDQPRGAGFWSWKPYIILATLNKIGKDDWLIYSDAGKPFRRGDSERAGNNRIGNVINTTFDSIIEYAKQHNGFTPGIWIPHYGSAKVWSKRDCFVGMGCDEPKYYDSGQVQAGYSCWSNSQQSRDFLNQWLNWVQIEAVISDNPNIYGKPNFPEFRDHRHDQSVMTNLVIKNNIQLFGSKKQSLNGYRDFNLILRHMLLSNKLKRLSNNATILFRGANPVLPGYAEQAIKLWLLPDLSSGDTILVYDESQKDQWQSAFPNTKIQFGANIINKNQKIKNTPHFIGIFVTTLLSENELPTVLADCYEALLPGGVLILGPYTGEKTDKAALNSSFNELVQWIFINQRFPPSLSSKDNQKQNSITTGNTPNPFIIPLKKKQCQIILRKPHIQSNC